MWKTKIFIFTALCCGLCGAFGPAAGAHASHGAMLFKASDYYNGAVIKGKKVNEKRQTLAK